MEPDYDTLGRDFALDAHGNRVYPGDYVRCLVTSYFSIKQLARKRVKAIDVNGNLILKNAYSPTFDGPYKPGNFEISGRYHPYHHGGVDKRRPRNAYLTNSEKEAGTMLHLAILVEDGENYKELADTLNDLHDSRIFIADTSASALKEKVRARISVNPKGRWLILSGNTLAESAAPPVNFRQW